jgi:competence protein ComEC
VFDLRKIPILRVLVPYFCGVVPGIQHLVRLRIFGVILLAMLFWLSAVLIYRWQGRKPGSVAGLICLPLFLVSLVTGAGTGFLTKPRDPGLPVDRGLVVRGTLQGSPRVDRGISSFDLELQFLCSVDTVCRPPTVLKAYFRMPPDSILPVAGETWQFYGKLEPIRNSGNPGSPDYRAIMGRKNCWYRFYIDSGWKCTRCGGRYPGKNGWPDPGYMRDMISGRWKGEAEEISLLKAVCLGDRSSLTDDMRQAYAAAGGMHLLAVSGLHVGLIWWILRNMTSWLTLLFRKGKRTIRFMEVGLLWFYAFLTGFSSSVCRSVTMFSFFSLSRLLGVRHHPLNAVLVSAFFLVLFHPVRMTDAGFQLSYAAVTGIVVMHPLSMRLLRVKNRILRRIWEATSVSLAAQLFTAPLVIYYFHQLPVYALLTSLVAVPMLSLLIILFVCSVSLYPFGFLQDIFNFLLVKLAWLMNHSMETVSSLPGAVLRDLHLQKGAVPVCLLALLACLITLHHRRRMSGYLLIFLACVSITWSALQGGKRRISSELVIAHFRGISLVSLREGTQVDHYCWVADSSAMDYMANYLDGFWNRRTFLNHLFILDQSSRASGSISSCIPLTEGVWVLGGGECRGLVFTGSLSALPRETGSGQGFPAPPGQAFRMPPGLDFILLSGEPSLDALPDRNWMGGTPLVADGSNRNWYQDRIGADWGPVYLTLRSGAYIKRW